MKMRMAEWAFIAVVVLLVVVGVAFGPRAVIEGVLSIREWR